MASFTGDGGYDQEGVYAEVGERHPDAAVIIPPRATAVPGETAETVPTQRDRHLQLIAEHGRMGWQKRSGYTGRSKAEAAIGRWKRVIGDGLRSRTDRRRATEVNVGVCAFNRMLLVWTAPGGIDRARLQSLPTSDKGDRPWIRLAGLGWTRRSMFFSCTA